MAETKKPLTPQQKIDAAAKAIKDSQAEADKLRANSGSTTPTTGTAGEIPLNFLTASVYSIWVNGKRIDLTRDELEAWAFKNLDSATIKSYQNTFKSIGSLSSKYLADGKIDQKGQFTGALASAIDNQKMRGVQGESLAEGISFMKEYYAGRGSGSGAATEMPRAYVSSSKEISGEINNQFQVMFGENAPKDVIAAYTKELNTLQLSRTSAGKNVKGVKVITEGVDAQERADLLNKYVKSYSAIKVAKAASGDKTAIASLNKGVFGTTLTQLKNAYADNGVSISDKSLNEQVLDGALSKEKLESKLNLIRLSAKILFPALEKHIDAGYSVKQLMSPYLQSRAQILEEDVDTIDLKSLGKKVNNPDGTMMSLYDYEISMRQDPKWRFTKNAQDGLSSVAATFAKTFGVMG